MKKKTAMSSYQIKSLGIQLCTIFELVSSFSNGGSQEPVAFPPPPKYPQEYLSGQE